MDVGSAYVKVRPDTAAFGGLLSTEVGAASRKASVVAGREAGVGFSEGFRSALKTGALLVGVTAGLSEVVGAVEKAGAHAGEIALLNRAIQDAGASETILGTSAEDAIRKQALQRGFIDEQLYPAFTRLVGATHSSVKAYADLGLAEDVARQRHVDVTIAALALAKAEQGSVTSLQRLGIILPAHVRSLEGAAKATAALEIVQQRFGGSADAFAKSSAGAFQRFAEARHVLEETAGAALAPEITKIANATADWTSKSENLARVEHDVAAVGQVVAGSVKAIGVGLHGVSEVAGPVVRALGGIEKTTELAFGVLAVRKIQVWTAAIVRSAAAAVTGETAVAAATTTEAAATTAATAASVRQVAVYGARGEVLATVAVAEEGVAAATTASGVAAAASGAKFLSFGASAGGAASVLKSGVAPAAVLAGYELSTFIRKIPGWNTSFESLGAHAEKLAGQLGLVGNAHVNLTVPSQASFATNADKLSAAYAAAIKQVPNASQDFEKQARDAIVASLVGPGFNFHDAQVAQANQQNFQRGQGGAGQRRNYDPGQAAAARNAARPTDVDYQIQLQQALATKTTADEKALYEIRLEYITRRVDALKKDNSLTADEKKNLLRLETEQVSLQSAITGIDTQAAQAAKDAATKAHQAYTDLLSVREQSLHDDAARAQLTQATYTDDLKAARAQLTFDKAESDDRKLTAKERAQYASSVIGDEQQIQSINQQIHTSEKQAYTNQLSLTEQRLQLAAQRAQLTERSIADDKAAARKLIAFYTKESHDAKLTEAERLQFASQAINEKIALKGLSGQQQGATVGEIFRTAASEVGTYGSNIASRGGILSGQDARAAFGAHLLGAGDFAARAAAQQRSALLAEAQKQSGLLGQLVRAANRAHTNIPPADQIANARRVASLVGR